MVFCAAYGNSRNVRSNGKFPDDKKSTVEAILEKNLNTLQPKMKRNSDTGSVYKKEKQQGMQL